MWVQILSTNITKLSQVKPSSVPNNLTNDLIGDRNKKHLYPLAYLFGSDSQWVNGVEVMNHTGGHLPFEVPVNKYVTFSGLNRVTIAINNTLTPHTLPTGSIQWKDGKGSVS